MLEGVLEKVLQQKLGQYLEGFDKHNLSVSIWSGNIHLENLLIKAGVFQALGLPLRIVFGKIKRLHIKVPWTNLQSSPVEFVLESLMLVVSPLDKSEWRAKDKWSFEHKQKQLDEFATIMAEKLKVSLSQKQSGQKEEGFVDRIATKILDNIQLTIKNIHIRYEDENFGLQYSLGLTLQELAINTTNQNWDKTYYDRTKKENKDKPLFKRLSVKGLAMYLHFKPKQTFAIGEGQDLEFSRLAPEEEKSSLCQPDLLKSFAFINSDTNLEIEEQMSKMLPQNAVKIQGVPYFIEPIYLEVKLVQLTRTKLDKPNFSFDVQLDEINVSLTKQQYEIIFQLGDYFKQYSKFIEKYNMVKKYKHLRPIYPIKFKPTQSDFQPVTFDSVIRQDSGGLAFPSLVEIAQHENNEDNDIDFYQDAFDTSFSREKQRHSEQLNNPFQTQGGNWWKYAITCVKKENRFKKGFWNEFKLTSWRKNQYAKHLIKLIAKCITIEYTLDNQNKLSKEENYLYKHIIEANEIQDIQNWIGIFIKKRIEKEHAAEVAKKLKKKEAPGFFSNLFSKKVKKEEQLILVEEEEEEISFSEEEINQIQISLMQILDSSSDENKDFGFSEQQLSKLVRVNANLIFKRGRINLLDDTYRVELYQDDLTIGFNFRRDSSFELSIGNRSVGLNVIDLEDNILKEIVVRQGVRKLRKGSQLLSGEDPDEQPKNNNLQWSLQINKRGILETGFMTDIIFESNPIKMKYDAVAFSKISQFFKTTGTSEELRAQAYDKITALKDQTQSSIKDLLYKKSNNIIVKIASPILEMPFKAHNSALIGEAEELRDRMWQLNLGNIDFQTYVKPIQVDQQLDEYERFKLDIDSFGLKFIKHGQAFNVLEEVELKLEIGIKNKIKAALIEGTDRPNINQQDPLNVNQGKFSPGVVVIAELPSLILNATPDVYNGLVNLKQVLVSKGAEIDLQQLLNEKKHIIENSSYHHEEVLTRGLKGSLSSYWHSFVIVISGSYIYFYKAKRDLMPNHFVYLADSQISSFDDLQELPEIQNKQTDFKNALLVKQRNGDILYLKFNDEIESQEFMEIIARTQQELKGEVNILKKQDILSDLIHKDQNEVGFTMEANVGLAEIRIWQTNDTAIQNQQGQNHDDQWLLAQVKGLKFSIHQYQYEINLLFILNSISISETLHVKQELLINEPGQNLVEIDIDIFDIYSPNLEDAEIIVNLRLCKLYLLFEPTMINDTVKFFRNVKSFEVFDIESLNVRLMEESEMLFDRHSFSSHSSKSFRRYSQRKETCQTIDLILVKVNVEARGLTLIALHNVFYTPLFELCVGKSVFGYAMHFDHDVIRGDFENARVYDLTNYPNTIDPETAPKGCLKGIESYKRLEIIGIRDSDEGGDNVRNALHFESILYSENCPLHSPIVTSSLKVEVASIKLLFCYEMSFRVIDYFMDKLLWAITESDYYIGIDQKDKKRNDAIDIGTMSTEQIMALDMKQEKNTMLMEFKIHKPYLILKDRPYLQTNLELDLGEITISYQELTEFGRFKKAQDKPILVSKYIIKCSDLGIKYSGDRCFDVAPAFDMKLEFSYLNHTQLLKRIDSHELDKSFRVNIDFMPQLILNLRQDIFTFILRCIDLNFAFTDYLEEKFNFRNEEDYFRSSDELLKAKTQFNLEFLALRLFTKTGEQFTELGMKNPQILINYYLNRQHNYDIVIEEMNSFFTHGADQKLLLFGNLSQSHCVPSFDDLKECICGNQYLTQSIIVIHVQISPNGNKKFQIDIAGIKLFLHPYFYMMIDHFFREGQPTYDMNSIDKPNEYNEDFEEYPEMKLHCKMADSLICFIETDNNALDQSTIGIACQANMDYDFVREKIKEIKLLLWDKISNTDPSQQQPDQQTQHPISWMRLVFKQLSPYICDLSDLELNPFSDIRKRQIVQPFETSYHYGKFLQYRWKEKNLFVYEKSETKKDKIVIKVSYQDLQLLQLIFSEFTQGFSKFNDFLKLYMKNKRQSSRGNKEPLDQISIFRKTQNAMKVLRNQSMSASQLSSEQQQSENINYFMVPNPLPPREPQDKKTQFLGVKIDYEKEADFTLVKWIVQGVQVVIINESNNIFYPVLTVNMSPFEYKSIGEFGHINGNCQLKAMVSYYNASASEWEPLLEKTTVELMFDSFKGQVFNLISLKKNLNINITTQLLQTLLQTYTQMQEQKVKQADTLQQQISRSSYRQAQYQPQSQQHNKKQQQTRHTVAAEQQKSQLEYKVTPYTIVNYSSRVVTVKTVYYTNNDRLKVYVIQPGEKVDYEVDYEEEVRHLMRETSEEVVKKQDYLNVSFEGSSLPIKNINLRNQNFYHHILNEKNRDDYVAYGVKFENMRKVLIIRAPFVFNNLTDVTYSMRLLKNDGQTVIKLVNLIPEQCYPLDFKEIIECKFQLSCEGGEWSSPIRIKTIVEKVPKNATTFLYHGKQFTVITKEKSESQKNYNINFKTPVIILNALPCNMRIRTDIIIGKLTEQQMPYKSKDDEGFEFEQKEMTIQRGQQVKLHNYNLKSAVNFLFTIDTNTTSGASTHQQNSFQWGEFRASNSEFKDEKIFMLKDQDNLDGPKLEVYAKLKKCKEAGVRITFYVRNVIVNNTDQRLLIFYPQSLSQPAAGQVSSADNSVILLSDRPKVVACIEDFDMLRGFSSPFNVDVAAVTNTIQIRKKEQLACHEFTVKTELSRACNEEEVYTKVTTISPCFVLHNRTRKTILITQEECLEQCQILLPGARVPFFWKDYRRPRLVRIKCVEREGAEFDDDSHDWTFSFALNEIGRMSIINRHKRSLNRSKYLLVDKQLQEENQILFITFNEETPQFATYRVENHSKHVHIEYYQKDYPHNTAILLPEQNAIFSWTNPHNTEYKITCKFFGSGPVQETSGDVSSPKIEIEPDNLELNERVELPKQLWNGRKNRHIFIYTITNGFSKILVFSDISQENQLRKKDLQIDEELKEGEDILTKTFKVELFTIGVSLICQTYKEKRKEFAFLYFEDLKFIVLEAQNKREVQLKIGYSQIDNNISHKPVFPVIMYPKELVQKRDKLLQLKKKAQDDNTSDIKDFFNMHFTTRLNEVSDMLFFEEIDFLVQTIVLQMDDEFIGYIYRFLSDITDNLHTNITGVHEIFKRSLRDMDHFIDEEITFETQGQQLDSQRMVQSQMEEESKSSDQKPEDILDQLLKLSDSTQRNRKQIFTVRAGGAGDTAKLGELQQEMYDSQIRSTQNSSSMNAFSQQHSQSWLNYNVDNKAKKLYIKEYKSSPIDIELSYLTKMKTEAEQQANKKFSFRDKVKNFGLTLANVDGAQVRINSLLLANIFGTPNDIVFQLKSHYMQRLKKNLFNIVGSSNILGNPANFVNHLGTGVQDFFYMPINGIVKGPLEGGKGIVMGTRSLIKNTVQGTFGSASKVLSSVSKGLLLITNDGEFINNRDKNNQNRPANVIEGVGYGLKSTFLGFASGITGVVSKPIQGAQKEGPLGFLKGTYKGLSGLVVKPVSGALDFFSKTSEGIKNTAGPQQKKVKKTRLMRPFYGKLQLIKAYNEFHAEVIHEMNKLEKGRYAQQNFFDAILYNELSERKQKVIILTEQFFLVMDPSHRDIILSILSENVMAVGQQGAAVLNIYVVDAQQNMTEGFKMKIDSDKTLKRNLKIIQNYIQHVRTNIASQ